MTEVKLYTSGDGRYVVTVYVPPFTMMPDIIFWGSRVFMKREDGEYREAFVTTGFTKEELFGVGIVL